MRECASLSVTPLEDLEEALVHEIELLNAINEKQFKIISESLATISRTVDVEKIEYLKKIILSSVKYSDYGDYESILISRIIRDITSEEIKFLLENFSYESVHIYSWYNENDDTEKARSDLAKLQERINSDNGLLLLPNKPECYVANGLANLGVFAPGELSYGVHIYKFSGVAVKLITLLTR